MTPAIAYTFLQNSNYVDPEPQMPMWFLYMGILVAVLSFVLYLRIASNSDLFDDDDLVEEIMAVALPLLGAIGTGIIWPISLFVGGVVYARRWANK